MRFRSYRAGHKIVLTEDYPLDESESGAREQKRCAVLTWEGLKQFLDALGFNDVCNTMGALTLEFGVLPAISFTSNEDYTYIDY